MGMNLSKNQLCIPLRIPRATSLSYSIVLEIRAAIAPVKECYLGARQGVDQLLGYL
jgi:hypothetical protein